MVTRYIPAALTAGLSFTTTLALSDYPAPTWGLTLHLRGPSNADITATDDGASHKLTIPAATSEDFTAGQYWYSIRVTDGTDTHEIEKGTINVLPDLLSQEAGYDGRSQAEIALAAIDAVLANRATMDQERYRINNRELYRTSIGDLLKLQTYYSAIVRRERSAGASGGVRTFGRNIPVRFS